MSQTKMRNLTTRLARERTPSNNNANNNADAGFGDERQSRLGNSENCVKTSTIAAVRPIATGPDQSHPGPESRHSSHPALRIPASR
jgi:hypothetical protein